MIRPIQWMTQDTRMPAVDKIRMARWIEAVARTYDRLVGPLTYIFCSDDRIIEINLQYIEHDYYTDIITFDYSRGKMISGDIFISTDTVESNAPLYGDADRELHRVIIHGVLHLCGLHDKSPEERREMEAAEDEALRILENID